MASILSESWKCYCLGQLVCKRVCQDSSSPCTWTNFLCRLRTTQDINGTLLSNHGQYVTPSLGVSLILQDSLPFPLLLYNLPLYQLTFTMKMEALYLSKMMVPAYQTAWCHDPENRNICRWNFSGAFRDSGKLCSRHCHGRLWESPLSLVSRFLSQCLNDAYSCSFNYCENSKKYAHWPWILKLNCLPEKKWTTLKNFSLSWNSAIKI
jgi:hypothetical protein